MINKAAIPPLLNILTESGSKPTEAKKDFSAIFNEAMQKVNGDLLQSEKMTQDFALGKNIELHQVMIATEQANMALQLTIQIRNKIVEAYQEITRMQV